MKNKSVAPAHAFYAQVLKELKESKFTFMVAGGFAVNFYTGLRRPTKDIDIFVKYGDYPKILNKFTSLGYKTQVSDERWLAKIFKRKLYVDLIFGSSNLVAPVNDDWFKDSKPAKFFNHEVKVPSVTDLIWSKVFIQNRDRYDGADIAQQISQNADVLALCGDLTHLGLPVEAERLCSELRACRIPVVAVLGNHDYQSGQSEEVKKVLLGAKVTMLEEAETFEMNGVGFAGVKGFGGGFDKHMLTPFGEPSIKGFVNEAVNESLRLEVALNGLRTEKIVVVLHYAPIAATVAGEPPEIFPFLGSSRLAETIDHFDVSAVFHGHAHHGACEGRTTKGIPVYNCCLKLMEATHPERPYALIEV